MVPTYGSKGTRRYTYYETRKDLARPGDPPSARFQRGLLDRHVVDHLLGLLTDEHALRRLSAVEDAQRLGNMFQAARLLAMQLQKIGEGDVLPSALGFETSDTWARRIPLPARKPFREAKLRIDASPMGAQPDQQLIELLVDAFEVQKLVLASPELSINQLSRTVGRCRKQMVKLFRVSWPSPRIVEAIAAGVQPRTLTRTRLLASELPVDWAEQEALFGLNY